MYKYQGKYKKWSSFELILCLQYSPSKEAKKLKLGSDILLSGKFMHIRVSYITIGLAKLLRLHWPWKSKQCLPQSYFPKD